MKANWQKFYPLIFGIFIAVLFALFGIVPPALRQAFPEVVIVNSLNIGFLSSALSILLSSPADAPLVKRIRDMGEFEKVSLYFVDAIKWNFAVAGLSIIGLMLIERPEQNLVFAFCALWFGVSVTGFVSTYRVMSIFLKGLGLNILR